MTHVKQAEARDEKMREAKKNKCFNNQGGNQKKTDSIRSSNARI
jgi:hypothetical protein